MSVTKKVDALILPIDRYNRIELLTPSKPYCKVRKDGKWQIYDIERQELVSDEWDGEQTAKIVDKLPVKDEE